MKIISSHGWNLRQGEKKETSIEGPLPKEVKLVLGNQIYIEIKRRLLLPQVVIWVKALMKQDWIHYF